MTLLLLITVFLPACNNSSHAPTSTPSLQESLLKQIDAAQAQHIRLTFDPGFGFPNLLSSGDPEIVDGGEVWRVMAFEALE
jgi:hypothetical protein